MKVRGLASGLWAAIALAGTGCFGEISWSNHLSFRSYGRGLHLSHVDPDEVLLGRISRNMHYVSISLDSVFFRDLPGLFQRDVVFGFEIGGAGDKRIKTVLEVTEAAGEHAFLSIDNAAVLQPFLYKGQNIEITLWFKSTAKDNVGNVKGQLAGVGDTLKKLNPLAEGAVNLANGIFDRVIGAFVKKEQSWKYAFTLYPADSTYRDKPELLFTAGRHILLSMPPAGAPKPYRFLKPANLIKYLGLRGNRLVWRHNDEEFHELPYIILNVTRFKRYPSQTTPLRLATNQMEAAYEQGNLELARNKVKELGGLIFEDKVITQREKNLEQLYKEFREAKIDTAQAEKDGNKEKQLEGMLSQIKFLSDILANFPMILEPADVSDVDFKLNRLVSHYERLAQIAGKPADEAQKLLELRRAKIEQARAEFRKEEIMRQKMLAKYDTAKVSKTPPPPEILAAIKDLRTAVTRPWRKWWFWTAVGVGVAAAGAATPFVISGTQEIKAPAGVGLGVARPGAP
jgi:hypothetical protein